MSQNKLFWMRWDIPAAQRDTSRLNHSLYGVYISLIEEEFMNGPLPNEIGFLCNRARIFSMTDAPSLADPLTDTLTETLTEAPRRPHGERERMLFTILDRYFELGPDNCWRQKRVEKERAKALKGLEINRAKTKNATLARWKNRTPTATSTHPSTDTSTDAQRIRGRIQSLEGKASTRGYEPLRVSPPLPDGAAAPRGGSQNQTSPAGKPAPGKPAAGANKSKIKAKPSKKGVGRIARGRNDGKGRGGLKSRVAVPLRPGNDASRKQGDPSKVKFLPDSRLELVWGKIFGSWDRLNSDVPGRQGKCPRTVKDEAAVSAFLRGSPDLKVEDFERLLRSRELSDFGSRTQAPHSWIGNLLDYADGPLDRYKHPVQERRY